MNISCFPKLEGFEGLKEKPELSVKQTHTFYLEESKRMTKIRFRNVSCLVIYALVYIAVDN